jgi:two-component system, sensor histidine kinase and response regulator
MVRGLLREYQISSRRLAERMDAAFLAEDFARLGSIAHELKSSSRSVGALNLGDLCAELENACRTLVRQSIACSMSDFDAELQVFDAHLDEWIALTA